VSGGPVFVSVFEPGETVLVEPGYSNASSGAISVTGTASNFTGPGGATYTLVDGTANFSKSSLLVGDTLYFTLTVENYGAVPIRTSGPPPGYVYNLDQNYNVPGFAEESGAWRVGIDFGVYGVPETFVIDKAGKVVDFFESEGLGTPRERSEYDAALGKV